MNQVNKIDGLLINAPKVIHVAGGSVFRALRNDDKGFCGFKEVYFSTINFLSSLFDLISKFFPFSFPETI